MSEYVNTNLSAMLHFGYVIDWPGRPPRLPFSIETLEAARAERATLSRLSEDAVCDYGIDLWKRVCRRVLDSRDGPFVLPLSAGLDSRAVLAGLVSQGARDIRTVTYGVPGSYDYEIAPAIAQAVGMSNERIDLRDIEVDRDCIDAIAREPGRVSFLIDMYFNRVISDRFGTEPTYLNGYLGDVLAGKYVGGGESDSWDAALRHFAKTNRHSRTEVLTHPDIQPTDCLPQEPFVDASLLSYDDQLGYTLRQECLMRPIVMRAGYDCVAPMLDPEWEAFMLALNKAQRDDRYLFKQMFQRGFPQLFSLPTAVNGGLPLSASPNAVRRHERRVKRRRRLRAKLSKVFPALDVPLGNRGWKYIDFKRDITGRKDLAALFEHAMHEIDQAALAPWINATGLWKEHVAGTENHGKALGVLLNLAVLHRNRPDVLRETDASSSTVPPG